MSLCFVSDSERVMREAARVLCSDGRLVIGIIPANSPWGEMYAAMAEEGHPIYSMARFFTVSEVVDMAKSAGFDKHDTYSTLVAGPDSQIRQPQIYGGTLPAAGFVAMSFSLKQSIGKNAQ